MPEDTIAKWRRGVTQAAAAPPLEVVGGREAPGGEEAHASVEGQNRAGGWLEVRPARGPWSLLSYPELLQVDYDPHLAFIVLIFRHVMVTVKGRNLDELMTGLRTRLTSVIAQYDPERHGTPEKNVAVVEAIEFTTQRLSESVSMMRGQGKE
jgi:hypothetical protein